ncbi:MAG: hypothetical protein KAH38_09940 [Candidatus Hydrogenedentes bacterium]|nr:hypothetical protein [Candidatus Hydrogenedentota bacterium]
MKRLQTEVFAVGVLFVLALVSAPGCVPPPMQSDNPLLFISKTMKLFNCNPVADVNEIVAELNESFYAGSNVRICLMPQFCSKTTVDSGKIIRNLR